MRYYIYRHVRLDTGEPFYIGIGTKPENFNTWKQEYKRAYSKSNRSLYWRNINNLVGKEVEIVMEFNTYQEVKSKEIEFVKLYGRRDLNTGNLANFTNGGDGTLGLIPWNKGLKGAYSQQYRAKISESRKGCKMPQETRDALNKVVCKPIVQIKDNINTYFKSSREAAKQFNIDSSIISAVCRNNLKGKNYTYKGYKFEYVK